MAGVRLLNLFVNRVAVMKVSFVARPKPLRGLVDLIFCHYQWLLVDLFPLLSTIHTPYGRRKKRALRVLFCNELACHLTDRRIP
jgi:hypothetical protein